MSAPTSAPPVAGFPLPRDLARRRIDALAAVASGAAGAHDLELDREFLAWADTLPAEVDRLRRAWGIELSEPFSPGGTCSWVAPTRGADGADLVLKVTWAHEEARDEAAGLLAWQGRGAVRMERCETSGRTAAMLLERCLPGTALAEVLPDVEQDEVIARMLRAIWIEAPADGPFRPLSSMCEGWADAAQRRHARMRRLLPQEVIDRGLALFRTLPREAPREVLLATDLHHGNVLLATDDRRGEGAAAPCSPSATDAPPQGWRLIDPKPYVGDPHYDITQHLLNFPERMAADAAGFVDRMADLCGLDRDRARAWAFARCVQEAGWMRGAPEGALRLAEVVAP